MEGRLSLREFQAQLTERLQNASRGQGGASKLGFLAGGRYWLTDLSQVNEVTSVAEPTAVPWARSWFLGVASVRGAVFGCTDLAAFLGLGDPMGRGEYRLLLAHPRFGVNAAFRIEKALGLRNMADMQSRSTEGGADPWLLGQWEDRDGQIWTELSIEHLVESPRFLQAGL